MTTAAERQLAEDRANRSAARGVFDANLAQVKGDLAARSVGGRIADQAVAETRAALTESVAIARESKSIIAATIGALLLWAFRAPLVDAVLAWLGGDEVLDDDGDQAPVQQD